MNYWVQRLGTALLLLFAVSVLTFGAMNTLGDPLFNILGPVARAKDVQGTAQIDGYAYQAARDNPTVGLVLLDGPDELSAGESVLVAEGDTLPRRADTVAPLESVAVESGLVSIADGVSPGSAVLNGPEPEQLADVAEAEERFYLDRPLPERYVRWLGDFVTGDMGPQFSKTGEPPVTDLIKERLPRSAMLLIMAQLLATVIAIPWSLWSASKANTVVDRASTFSTFLIIALPNFALGVVLKYLLAIRLGWFPQTFNAADPFLSRVWQMFLPALTIALPAAAVYQRLLRTDLITTLQEDFILMARSKGVSRRNILFKHALRPSLFSFVTVFGINTGALIGGSLIVETIFRVPGLGSAVVEAVVTEDFPVVLAIVMIIAVAFVAVNVIVDVLYSLIDPRVRR
ncbi:MAG: ABC transporter permease subunit [Ilumatobacter sp.]|uniref:ABC transporter permease n=1 Tax=Ilumatobacter sp. TaxID=1967498 RepID=UPI002624079A|nr:ABC transporter permease subunit [Ilumatobacter sp.]MDJ0767304.1 ABC transporter permease subunit [Ilumatobacter sp.]